LLQLHLQVAAGGLVRVIGLPLELAWELACQLLSWPLLAFGINAFASASQIVVVIIERAEEFMISYWFLARDLQDRLDYMQYFLEYRGFGNA
jgi:hypothetical protein